MNRLRGTGTGGFIDGLGEGNESGSGGEGTTPTAENPGLPEGPITGHTGIYTRVSTVVSIPIIDRVGN